jgi:alpha-galactosidase
VGLRTQPVLLRRAGVLVVLDAAGPHLPRVLHWGADLGELTPADLATLPGAAYSPPTPQTHSATAPVTLSPSRAQGWAGRPGLTGHRAGAASQPLFTLAAAQVTSSGDRDVVAYRGVDAHAQLEVAGELELTADGVLRHRQRLTSTAAADAEPYVVDELITLLPVSEHAAELLDHGGRWGGEGYPQRHALAQGSWLREQRRGRTGHDAPLLLMAGTAGFGHRHGEVWGVHLAWSGDQRYIAQRLDTGATLLGAAELYGAGEVRLGAGESVTTPWVYGVWSGRGIDGATARLHAMLRRRPEHPRTPRPILLNTWEAVYFDHSFERLAALADVAAEIGVERFVIDDGWFGSRRSDRSGLGDWYVSADVWPAGLGPIATHVRERGMEFGLWVEPEMINPDSELAREHPDWILGTAGRTPPPQRSQQVLDLGAPGAYDHLLARLSELVAEYDVRYLKWDHNRDTADPVHRAGPRADRPALHEQIAAAYRLMDELKARNPGLEIESCASGGARTDYGVLEHTDRVWASDCSDPLERVRIVSALSTLVPLELIGAHVAAGRSHTTGRMSDLGLRMAVALFGHSGLEWDLSETTAAERARLAQWIALVKRERALLHTGELVRVDRPADPGTSLLGVVAPGAGAALFLFARLASGPRIGDAPVVFAGLDPVRRYRVERLSEFEAAEVEQSKAAAPVLVEASGAVLMTTGIGAPGLLPEQAVVYRLAAVSAGGGPYI